MVRGRQRFACSEAGRLIARKRGRLQGVVRLIAAAVDCGAQPGCAQGRRVACCGGDGRVSKLAAVAAMQVERAAGAAAVGCRDLSALAAAFEARTLVVSVKVVVVCIVVRLPW